MMTMRDIQKFIAPLYRRVSLMIGRGIVRLIDEANEERHKKLQIDALSGETLNGVEFIEPYGLSAYPRPGAEAVIACPQGNRDAGVIILVGDRRYRLKGLAEGEVALYTDEDQQAGGCRIHLKRNQEIEVYGKKLTANISGDALVSTSGKAEINAQGNAKVTAMGTVTTTSQGMTTVNAPSVYLGGAAGAIAVARLGDQVQIGAYTGTIISASSKVFAQ